MSQLPFSVVLGKKHRIKDILMKKNLNLKDKRREKAENFLSGGHNVLPFQRDFFYVYKALERTGKVHFTFLR